MKQFTAVSSSMNSATYSVFCDNGKVVGISCKNKLGSCDWYREPKENQSSIYKDIFRDAFYAMCTDMNFNDFTNFFIAIADDEIYLPIAQEMLLKQIKIYASRIGNMSKAWL